ncbi:hypothetical protein Tco_0190452 [Tanacetum coccineum]
MMELILDVVEDRLDDDWFTGTVTDEDDLDGESYTKVRVLEIEEMPRTSSNIATVRAELMKEMGTAESVQRET